MARGPATRVTNEGARSSRGREVAGIILLGLSLFVGLSVMSLQIGAASLMGPCGATVGLGVYALCGIGAYLFAFGLGVGAVRCLGGRPLRLKSVGFLAAVGATVFAAVLLHLLLGHHRLRGFGPGGLVGEYGAELMISMVGRVGAFLFGAMGLSVSLVLSTPLSMRQVGAFVGGGARWLGHGLLQGVVAIFPERGERDEDEQKPARRGKHGDDTLSELVLDIDEEEALEAPRPLPRLEPKIELPKKPRKKRDDEAQLVKLDDAPAPVIAAADDNAAAPTAIIENEKTEISALPAPVEEAKDEPKEAPKELPKIVAPAPPKIVEPMAAKTKELNAPKVDYIPAVGGYHLPDLSLLEYQEPREADLDKQGKDEMLALADKLQKTLGDYGVKGHVQEIHPGPVVTMYEFVPAAGVKLSKISGLSNDLAMALAALKVRIVAPIPGKSSVGIEVPNKKREKVFLKEILVDEGVNKAKSKLTMGLGKDISGAPVAVDLAKMPHLLVAGTTGSGKSVGVNGMICSILFNANPEEVRMIMIDPKMVELSLYEGIPHLLLPVVTDPKKANLALRWAVEEMERRYESVSKAGVRDILSYNKKMEKLIADGPPKIETKKIKIFVTDENGGKEEVECVASEAAVQAAGGVITNEVRDDISSANALRQKQLDAAAAEPAPRKLPYIVVVIDEFADLMMVAPKDVETSVARIAQKARAVGIHLIVATQRPSVDVITGLIKANFPSRIAFQVASKIDARTILEQQGAENLLGQGDMLFQDRGQALRRIHGAYVDEAEIKRLVDFLKLQGKPVYDMDILKPREEEGGEEGMLPADEGVDPVYDQAVRLVCETRMASVSMIQRRLQIGFNRASRLVERMEREGIVGPPNGSKPREILAQAI